MLSRTLKAVLPLCLIASLAFAGYNLPAACSKDIQPIRIGAPPAGSFTDEDTTIFHEDFESGMGGWTTVDLTIQENYWHPDLFNAYQGNSWWCGDSNVVGSGYHGYDNYWMQYMDSPALDLSGATSPTLTFQVYWSVESPFNVPPPLPYDGWDGFNVWISTDGGSNFTPITPVSPAYTCNSLSSFGTVWGMGPNIPGWADQSGAWLPAVFNLSNYTTDNVVIRFAFCSDRAVASSTGHPELLSVLVDDVLIMDGATTYLSNNADDPPVPGEFTFEQGPPFGDWWEMTDSTSYSLTHCMRVDDDNFFINDALISPEITLPPDYTMWFEYAVLCHLPDSTHPGSTSLRDYYFVDITADGGETWEQQFYDYSRGYCYPNWGLCVPGIPYTGNTSMDLTQYAGETIQIRFRCVTDGDHISGNGYGLHIDDVWVMGSNMLGDDVGAAALHIPFPTSLSNGSVTGTVTLTNFGLNNQFSVPAFARRDSSSLIPLAPWAIIPPQQSVDKTFNWSLTATGDFYWDAFTHLLGDENLLNDTTSAAYVTVTPEHVYELGYDARQYQIAPYYYFSFEPGSGGMCRFVPAGHVLPEPVDIVEAKILFHSAGPCVFHLYDAGTASQPGAELYSANLNVNVTMPNWSTVDLSAVPEMLDRTEPFWIWIESENSNLAQICGDDAVFGAGHYFTYNGSSASPNNDYEFYIRVMAEEAQAPPLIAVNLTPENPPIYIPGSGGSFNFNIAVSNNTASPATFDVWTMATLPNGHAAGPLIGPVTVTVAPSTTINRDRTQAVGYGAPAGTYTYDAYIGDYPDDIWDEDHFDFTKLADDNGGPIVPEWANWGESFAEAQATGLSASPADFALHPAYPNPFNPVTNLRFSLPEPGNVILTIYDVQGKEVVRLVEGYRLAGVYDVACNASSLSSGIYFARLTAGNFQQTQKILLIK